MNAFWAVGFLQNRKIVPSGHFQRRNVYCLQLKGKSHPFTRLVLTQIIKAFVAYRCEVKWRKTSSVRRELPRVRN